MKQAPSATFALFSCVCYDEKFMASVEIIQITRRRNKWWNQVEVEFQWVLFSDWHRFWSTGFLERMF